MYNYGNDTRIITYPIFNKSYLGRVLSQITEIRGVLMNQARKSEQLLFDHGSRTPVKEIFQSVCDRLGKHYEAKGFKYFRSRPKLVYKETDLRLEIHMWSNNNTPGDQVTLEILPYFFSQRVLLNKKAKGIRQEANDGMILGYPAIFIQTLSDEPPGTVRVKHIYGEEMHRRDEASHEAVEIFGHTCNVYKITDEKFNQIIQFIDQRVLPYLDVLKDSDKLNAFLAGSCKRRLTYAKRSDFYDYISLSFPEEQERMLSLLQQSSLPQD